MGKIIRQNIVSAYCFLRLGHGGYNTGVYSIYHGDWANCIFVIKTYKR